jgi:phenylacetate-CoA ligase
MPNDIKRISDLEKLPVIRKDEIRQMTPSNLISNEYKIQNLKVLRTSGSTGKPFKFYINRKEDDWRKAIYLRANISCGQRPRDHWSVVTAPRHFYDTTKIQRIVGIFSQDCISVFSPVSEQVQRIREGNADIIDGYSGALYLLAKEVEKNGVEDISPRLMFGSADLIDSPSCKFIERVLNAPYYDQFGCAEVDRTAWQCPEREGYHMDVDSVVTEFVDSGGEKVAAGEMGEIVYTSLSNYAMPFIRYSVGDIGIPSDEPCTCGRSLPLMRVVEGRKDSLITLVDGRVVSPRTFTVGMSMFDYYDNIDQFRIIQKKKHVFDFYIKMKNNMLSDDVFRDKIQSHYEHLLNLSSEDLEINICFVDEIPLGKTGRLMAVVSQIN